MVGEARLRSRPSHYAAGVLQPKTFRIPGGTARARIAGARFSGARARCIAPRWIAAVGMPGASHELGSCANIMPPARRTASAPRAPSLRHPVKITPRTRGPNARAADNNNASADGLANDIRGPVASIRRPFAATATCRPGCATCTTPACKVQSFSIGRTASGVLLPNS